MDPSNKRKSGGGSGLFTLAGVAFGAVATGLGYSAWNAMQGTGGSLDLPLAGGAAAAAIASLFSFIMGARKPKVTTPASEQRRTAPEWDGSGKEASAAPRPAPVPSGIAAGAATAVAGTATGLAAGAATAVADTATGLAGTAATAVERDVPTVQLPADDPDGAIAELSEVAQRSGDTRNVVDVTESLAAAAGMSTAASTATATSAAVVATATEMTDGAATALNIDPNADMDIDMAALAGGEQSDEQWFDPLTGEGADGAPPEATALAEAASEETDTVMDEFNDLVFGGPK